MSTPLPKHLTDLRERHQLMRYESYSAQETEGGLQLNYRFTITPDLVFTPSLTLPCPPGAIDSTTERLAFLIGMVELLSYWKVACPAQIEIAAGYLSQTELSFWENLIRQGLGEFFYLNQIPPTLDFKLFTSAFPTPPLSDARAPRADSYLILVGGGKDSIVTLELMRRLNPSASALSTLVVNPIKASLDAISQAGYPSPLVVKRSIDPKLKELNAKGYLNGHTPFSALLSFISALVAYRNGFKTVLASNEASASEGNINYLGAEINHQYSKSLHYEGLVRDYLAAQAIPIEYLSFLRPLNELQICALFSSFSAQLPIFRSCNREQTEAARNRLSAEGSPSEFSPIRPGWCARCPKCVFTYLCLRCFTSAEQIKAIFGVDPAQNSEITAVMRELAGLSTHKPFECVGTFNEVRTTLAHLFANGALPLAENPELQSLRDQVMELKPETLASTLSHWNKNHFLTPTLATTLKAALASATKGVG
jgi:hypothetical protein